MVDRLVDLINGGSGFDKMVDHLQVCDKMVELINGGSAGGSGFDKMVIHPQVCDKMVDLINGGSGFDKMVDHLQVCDLLLPCVSKLVRILSLPCCCFVFYNRGLCPISELL
jgi:hypothetical protein